MVVVHNPKEDVFQIVAICLNPIFRGELSDKTIKRITDLTEYLGNVHIEQLSRKNITDTIRMPNKLSEEIQQTYIKVIRLNSVEKYQHLLFNNGVMHIIF